MKNTYMDKVAKMTKFNTQTISLHSKTLLPSRSDISWHSIGTSGSTCSNEFVLFEHSILFPPGHVSKLLYLDSESIQNVFNAE